MLTLSVSEGPLSTSTRVSPKSGEPCRVRHFLPRPRKPGLRPLSRTHQDEVTSDKTSLSGTLSETRRQYRSRFAKTPRMMLECRSREYRGDEEMHTNPTGSFRTAKHPSKREAQLDTVPTIKQTSTPPRSQSVAGDSGQRGRKRFRNDCRPSSRFVSRHPVCGQAHVAAHGQRAGSSCLRLSFPRNIG